MRRQQHRVGLQKAEGHKEMSLYWLTNSDVIYEPKCRGMGSLSQ